MRVSISVFALAALGALIGFAFDASAAELVMFRRDGCPWCARWDREIGPIYAKTDIGRRAPLRQVNLDREPKSAVGDAPIFYTPTFVLFEQGREVGRIEGYPGEDFFWPRVERLLELLPAAAPKARGAS